MEWGWDPRILKPICHSQGKLHITYNIKKALSTSLIIRDRDSYHLHHHALQKCKTFLSFFFLISEKCSNLIVMTTQKIVFFTCWVEYLLPPNCFYRCLSVHRGGSASLHAGIPSPPPGPGILPASPPGANTPPRHRGCWEIRSTRGRYPSYWNAMLFKFSVGTFSEWHSHKLVIQNFVFIFIL